MYKTSIVKYIYYCITEYNKIYTEQSHKGVFSNLTMLCHKKAMECIIYTCADELCFVWCIIGRSVIKFATSISKIKTKQNIKTMAINYKIIMI